ncbi:S-layer region-like protein [Calothrix sp. NIES-4071]|nr:S-layer region-like protein [Calothrix sp. NIES-4071]BAZ62192.1 S-layer region-like protein [Calothrix sp. NIES-4105]
MKNIWFRAASPVVLATVLTVNSTAEAEDAKRLQQAEVSQITIPVEQTGNVPTQTMSQVTSVSQLSDVQPTDWAFQALQSLVERYGCIAGYPNGTYRGNRAMTRYEFAAGVNACLDRVNELIATATADLVRKEDLDTIRRLQEEFTAELATLRGRVDAVEAKAAELEANRFSTTSKLQGQIVTVLSDVLSGDRVNGVRPTDNNATLATRTRIEFVTSFSGTDTLFTRLQANNINNTIVNSDNGTPEGNFFFAGDGTNDVELDALWYGFNIGTTQIKLLANAAAADDITDMVTIFDGDGAFGALSSFGTRNPIYLQVGGAGAAINQDFGDKLTLSLGYLSSTNNDPTPSNGVFNGAYAALAQLTVKPTERIKFGLTYINAYKQPFGTGSNAATLNVIRNVVGPNGLEIFNDDGQIAESTLGVDVPFITNSYGVEASIGLSERFVLGGWFGYSNTRNLVTTPTFPTRGSADIWNWAVTLGFPDLFNKGSLGGIIVGMEPKLTSSSINGLERDRDTSYHIEAFYQYRLSDNISITPGVIWLTAPDHNENNDDVVIGALRTTFSF